MKIIINVLTVLGAIIGGLFLISIHNPELLNLDKFLEAVGIMMKELK